MLNGGLLTNVEDAIGMLDDLEFQSVPFAAAKTLTRIAVRGQGEVRRQLPDRFAIRRDRVAKGVRIRPAKKDRLEASVYTMDWYMKDQQEGGVRGSRSGRSRLIPSLNVREGGVFEGKIRRAMRPRTLLRASGLEYKLERGRDSQSNVGLNGKRRKKRRRGGKPKAFVARMASGKLGLWVRTTDKRLPIELLYTIRERVGVDPVWEMDKTVSKVAAEDFRREFLENLNAAFERDRNRPGRRAYIDALLAGKRWGV